MVAFTNYHNPIREAPWSWGNRVFVEKGVGYVQQDFARVFLLDYFFVAVRRYRTRAKTCKPLQSTKRMVGGYKIRIKEGQR